MSRGATGGERGLTLLEVMVALVLLGLVVAGYLQLAHASHRLVARSGTWSTAVGFAAEGMEQVKLELPEVSDRPVEPLPDGFRRQITTEPWQPGLALVRVMVLMPDGGRFELHRLVPVDTTRSRIPGSSPGPSGER